MVRNDLNGMRLRLPNKPEIYLMDEGKRRWIPDPPTYNGLFRDWNGVFPDIDIDEIDLGTQITHGALLIRGLASPKVYLFDQNKKRHVTSPAVMDKYYFDWGKIHPIDQAVVDGIANGPDIN